jgi:DNA-binding NarL/FixJ family response regulator
MRAGARGYLVKGSAGADIAHAIEAAQHGNMVFGPAIADQMQRFFQSTPGTPTPFPELTDRETEVLRLVAARNSNAEIANLLYLSNKTVRNHISNIFTKLQVHSRTEAIQRGNEAGLNQRTPDD